MRNCVKGRCKMLAFVCEETKPVTLFQKIKQRFLPVTPKVEEVTCNSLQFLKVFIPKGECELNKFWLEQFSSENHLVLPQKIQNRNFLELGEVPSYIEQNHELAQKCEKYLEKKLEKPLKSRDIVVVDSDLHYIQKVKNLVKAFDNIKILTKNIEYYQRLSQEFYKQLGAVVLVDNLRCSIKDSFVIDFEDKAAKLQSGNIIFGNKQRPINGVLLTDFTVAIKKVYRDLKPKGYTNQEYYFALKEYADFSDELGVSNYTCMVNGVKKTLQQTFYHLERNLNELR